MIAYVKTGASIEQDIIDQLTSLFKLQKGIAAGTIALDIVSLLGLSDVVASLSGFGDGEGGIGIGIGGGEGEGNFEAISGLLAKLLQGIDMSSLATAYLREDEIEGVVGQVENRFGINVTDEMAEEATSFIGDGFDMFESTRSLGNFTFKEFASKGDLDDYISDERIGTDPDFDGVCFGFSVLENDAGNKYELELFFNDAWPGWLKSIPNQKRPVWNSYEYTPDTDDYLQYTQ